MDRLENSPARGAALNGRSIADMLTGDWPPAARFAAAGIGATLVTSGVRNKGPVSTIGGVLGVLLLGRAVWNQDALGFARDLIRR